MDETLTAALHIAKGNKEAKKMTAELVIHMMLYIMELTDSPEFATEPEKVSAELSDKYGIGGMTVISCMGFHNMITEMKGSIADATPDIEKLINKATIGDNPEKIETMDLNDFVAWAESELGYDKFEIDLFLPAYGGILKDIEKANLSGKVTRQQLDAFVAERKEKLKEAA